MIILWYGSVASIPTGFALCDGSNSTPDLRSKFVYGAGGVKNPGDTGGTNSHGHMYAHSHTHLIDGGSGLAAGTDYYPYTGGASDAPSMQDADHIPTYHALCYIMKL